MPDRVILLPVKRVPGLEVDDRGRPIIVEVPDWLGLTEPKSYEITINYHDVMKVRVSGTNTEVNSLYTRSHAYFDSIWGKDAKDQAAVEEAAVAAAPLPPLASPDEGELGMEPNEKEGKNG